MKKIGIIGCGFSGTMVAVHLIRNTTEAMELIMIDPSADTGKGIAYTPYSKKHLLNVVTEKMSAFKHDTAHFLEWVLQQKDFSDSDRNILSQSFLPRYLYGAYLQNIWQEALQEAETKQCKITRMCDAATDIEYIDDGIKLYLKDGIEIVVDECVIATGNHTPGNVKINNTAFYESEFYFQNPWKESTVTNLDSSLPVFIIGNGLTMVDTIIGLHEKGFSNEIYSISNNGFNILPHRHIGVQYKDLANELPSKIDLLSILHLFNKHIKKIKKFGLSAEPIIDSLRPYTQKIWQALSDKEKKVFMGRLRHLWGLARHRIPLHIHDYIQQLRIHNKLHIVAGKIIDIERNENDCSVRYYDKRLNQERTIKVARVINCTGPETNLEKAGHLLLKKAIEKGYITQDPLHIGINANPSSFEVLNREAQSMKHLYTLGGNLKGVLWESTAVNELRDQAERLAIHILDTNRS